MKSQSKTNYQFPQRFLWGASVSAHQVEGGTNNQWTAWEQANAKSLAHKAPYRLDHLARWDAIKIQAIDPDNYVSGSAVDHFNRFTEDFDYLKRMNMNSFRFSIEWSRIEPKEGEWSEAGLAFYHRYFNELRARKITPVVTLFHFSLPAWFSEKGGFERTKNIDYFVRFAEKVFDEYGAHLRLVCTINEPYIYVSRGWIDEDGWPPAKHGAKVTAARVFHNLALAHKRVFLLARRKSRRFKVGIAANIAHNYRVDDKQKTKLLYQRVTQLSDELFLRRINKSCDWIGLNFYFSNRLKEGRIENLNERVSDVGWEMLPDSIEPVIMRLHRLFNKPIIITENGVADMTDSYRKWWLAHTLHAMHSALRNGARVEGYLHWSLLDNFEWADGKWPRFGLVAVDYRTMEREIRQSGVWFGKVIARLKRES